LILLVLDKTVGSSISFGKRTVVTRVNTVIISYYCSCIESLHLVLPSFLVTTAAKDDRLSVAKSYGRKENAV
ncbi:hypothetical protein Tco_1097162, partial [Tanacetum coccineum]